MGAVFGLHRRRCDSDHCGGRWLARLPVLAGKTVGGSRLGFRGCHHLVEQGKHTEAEAAFAKIAAGSSKGYAGLARLRTAAEVAFRDPQEAAKLYDAIASNSAMSTSEQDLARIRAGSLLMETAPYDAMRQRLEPATGPDRTYRHSARELLALSAWRNNDAVAARQWLDMIGNDAQTPAGMRSRAEALQALLPPAAKS